MKFQRTIRVLTAPPIMAFILLLSCLFFGLVYQSTADFLCSIGFLTVLPLLAYPMQPLFSRYREKGREGQRNLAILYSVTGYVAGTIYCTLAKTSYSLWLIFLTYFISGVMIFLSMAVFHIKASGHACGITGPMILAAFLHMPFWWLFILPYVLAMIASVQMKRHTVTEFILGGIIPVIAAAGLLLLL